MKNYWDSFRNSDGMRESVRPVFIYRKVVSRKAIPFLPNPKNPKYLLYFMRESLECGHEVDVMPTDNEMFVAAGATATRARAGGAH